VKLLIFLLLLGAVAYFAPGPVAHIESDIEISASRDRVWTVVSDLSGARLWDPLMKETKLVGDVKTGIGAARGASGALVKTQEKVIDWVPYNKIVFEATHDPKVTKFESSTIEVTPGGSATTRVRWAMDYQMAGGYLGFLADKVALGSIHQGRVDTGLSNLKRYAETGEPANY
jgi:hypothetical protein